jgi:hypothetical protein
MLVNASFSARCKHVETMSTKDAIAAEATQNLPRIAARTSSPRWSRTRDTCGGVPTKKTSVDLDRQIAADPTNPEPYLVLADQLLAAGDRHGELIALQNARRLKPKAGALAKKEAELLKALGQELFGALWPIAKRKQKKGGDRTPIHVDWFQGFVRGVRLSAEVDDETTKLQAIMPQFLQLPVARFVQHVSFGGVDAGADAEAPDYGSVIEMLDRLELPSTMASLFFGDHEIEDHEHKWNTIDKLGVLSKTLPKLERLRIHSCGGLAEPIDLSDLILPRLRELEIKTEHTECGDLIAHTCKLKTLERLTLSFGINTNNKATLADVKPILDGKKLPALTQLSLEWIDFGPALVEALVKSNLASRLVHLGIRSARLHDASVDVLLANKARFLALRSFDVALNHLTKRAQERLRTLCQDVEIDTQWKPRG